MARLLVERGAKVDKLWHASGLGLIARLEVLLASGAYDGTDDLSQTFWHACSGAQRRAAELLLGRGADLNWVPDYARGTPLDTAKRHGTRRASVIEWLQSRGARSSEASS